MENLFKIKDQSEGSMISAMDCFEALNEEEKERLNQNISRAQFKKGEIIIKEGFVASNIMLIESGLAKLQVTNDNKESTLSLLKRNQFIGIICTYACSHLNFSAVALENTSVIVIDIHLFNSFIENNGQFALRLTQHISGITNQMVHWLTRLKNKNIEGALAMLLLDFVQIFEKENLILPFTRKEMAEMLGYSKESVINTLSKFNKEGIIKVSDKEIQILKMEKLKMISKAG